MFSASSVFVALLLVITSTGTALTSTQVGDEELPHYARGCETLLERREW
jgi:hypothetical protein